MTEGERLWARNARAQQSPVHTKMDVDAGLSLFDTIVKHATTMAILVPWFLSWGIRGMVSFPLMWWLDRPNEKLWYEWLLGLVTMLATLPAAFVMWPVEHRVICALMLAMASPFVYLGARTVFGWAMPSLKAKLSAKLTALTTTT